MWCFASGRTLFWKKKPTKTNTCCWTHSFIQHGLNRWYILCVANSSHTTRLGFDDFYFYLNHCDFIYLQQLTNVSNIDKCFKATMSFYYFIFSFQFALPEYHLRDIINLNSHLVHQNIFVFLFFFWYFDLLHKRIRKLQPILYRACGRKCCEQILSNKSIFEKGRF
jgi:hypothetical protein